MVSDAMTRVNSSISSASSSPTTLSYAQHFISIKLTSKNYLFWRTQLLTFLRGQNLHGYIDGCTPCPASTISNTFGA